MYKTVAAWWAEPLQTESGSPNVVGIGMVMYDVVPKNAATSIGKRTADCVQT